MGLDMYLIKRKKTEKTDLWEFGDEMIYWRKANQIHNYFCSQGEELEEQREYKISKLVLENLLDKCNQVLSIVKTEKGEIQNGSQYIDGEWKPIMEEGIIITNEDEVADILPRCDGFFFGSTDYNQWYLMDIEKTKKELEEILQSIDWENEEVYYLASW